MFQDMKFKKIGGIIFLYVFIENIQAMYFGILIKIFILSLFLPGTLFFFFLKKKIEAKK